MTAVIADAVVVSRTMGTALFALLLLGLLLLLLLPQVLAQLELANVRREGEDLGAVASVDQFALFSCL